MEDNFDLRKFLQSKKLLKEGIIEDIINSGTLQIKIGSGTYLDSKPTKEGIERFFKELILHNFMDWEFYYNWTNQGGEYLQHITNELVKPSLGDLDSFAQQYVDIDEEGDYVIKKDFDKDKFITNFILNSKTLSGELKQDYKDYMSEYAGVELDEASDPYSPITTIEQLRDFYRKDYFKVVGEEDDRDIDKIADGSMAADLEEEMFARDIILGMKEGKYTDAKSTSKFIAKLADKYYG
jgi:hypothetical protein